MTRGWWGWTGHEAHRNRPRSDEQAESEPQSHRLTVHRVSWQAPGIPPIPTAVDHLTELEAEEHAAELRLAGLRPLVYPVEVDAA